jgi:hypothetical protein
MSSAMRARSARCLATQCRAKLTACVGEQRTTAAARDDHRLVDVELEGPARPGDADRDVVAEHLAQTMVSASHCVGLTLPGMIELPGSFSGSAARRGRSAGPSASQRTSLAIFVSAAASAFSAPCACTRASCAASASNLFGAG